jgi:hypothetical protein
MSSFRRLALVEVQLIMHCCTLHELLVLARCSRALLTAASNSFAWKQLATAHPPLVLMLPHPNRLLPSTGHRFLRWLQRHLFRFSESTSSVPNCLVLRFGGGVGGGDVGSDAGITLRWPPTTFHCVNEDSARWGMPFGDGRATLAAMQAGSLRSLDLRDVRLDATQIITLLQLPSLAQLSSLQLSPMDEMNSVLSVLPLHVPNLRRFVLSHATSHLRDELSFLPLAQLHQLTSLSLIRGTRNAATWLTLAQCTRIESLTLILSQRLGMVQLFAAPNLASLRRICIADLKAYASKEEEQQEAMRLWSEAFRNLVALHVFHYLRSPLLPIVLSALVAHCPSVTSVALMPVRRIDSAEAEMQSTVPSMHMLGKLLSSRGHNFKPDFQLHLRLCSRREVTASPSARITDAASLEAWQVTHDAWQQLAEREAGRVKLFLVDRSNAETFSPR